MRQTFLVAFCWFAVCLALPTFPVPTAGAADYVFPQIAGYVPQKNANGTYDSSELDKEGSKRYAFIPQSNSEWDSLGSSYSIEFWVRPDAPRSSPITGSWTNAPDEPQFQIILNRHPGFGSPNENVQFHFQITRTAIGMALVFWSGCGCLSDTRPETCGFGYLLNSDNRNLVDKRYLIPNRWTHVAITVDGDDLSTGLQTKKGHLYMDGVLVFSNTWADPGNGNRFKLPGLCQGGGMRVTGNGNFAQVTLGKHVNQDATFARPSLEYGFNGAIDELRFWKAVRTPLQISTYWNVALINAANHPPPYPSLVAYFRFNEPLTYGDAKHANFYSIVNNATYGIIITRDTTETTLDHFVQPQNASVSLIVTVKGRNLLTNVSVQGVEYATPVTFYGSNGDNTNSVNLRIISFSSALTAILESRQLVFLPIGSSTPILPSIPASIPQFFVAGTTAFSASLYCTNHTCGNIGGRPRSFWIDYMAFNATVEGTTSRLMFDFRSDCETKVDACGVCGGDNRDCQCVWYRDFRNARMAYVLFQWSRLQILGQIDCATNALDETLMVVNQAGWSFNDAVGETIIAKLNFMMNFYDGCLGVYCSAVSEFVTVVQAYMAAAGLPYSSP